MGFRLSTQTARVLFTILDGAGRWADRDGDADLDGLLDHAVALSRAVLEVASGSRAKA
jgi:hypothetical protein